MPKPSSARTVAASRSGETESTTAWIRGSTACARQMAGEQETHAQHQARLACRSRDSRPATRDSPGPEPERGHDRKAAIVHLFGARSEVQLGEAVVVSHREDEIPDLHAASDQGGKVGAGDIRSADRLTGLGDKSAGSSDPGVASDPERDRRPSVAKGTTFPSPVANPEPEQHGDLDIVEPHCGPGHRPAFRNRLPSG